VDPPGQDNSSLPQSTHSIAKVKALRKPAVWLSRV
jgi:hypothetical protein